jgi:CBS domain-containing protein
MAQKVRELMTSALVALRPSQPVIDAAKAMREHNIGSVLVIDNGQLKGLVTDRDIVVRAIADSRDPGKTTIAEVCSPAPVTVSSGDDAEEAVRRMREHSIRRIPVVDDGRAVGILSIGDLAIERDERSALADISVEVPNT